MSSAGRDIAANCSDGRITFGALFSLYLLVAFFSSLPNVISSHRSPSVGALSSESADRKDENTSFFRPTLMADKQEYDRLFPAWMRPHGPDVIAETPLSTAETELAALAGEENVRVKVNAELVGTPVATVRGKMPPVVVAKSAGRAWSLPSRSLVERPKSNWLERPQVRAPQAVIAQSSLLISGERVPKAAQCKMGDIAGWSNEDLLPEHKAILKARETAAGDAPPSDLERRLVAKGFQPGAPVFMQIFKDSSTLEVWLKKGGRYALFNRYQICRWSGSFGPKLFEGDKQSPEGYYQVDRQLFTRPSYKWKSSFSIGYPNAYDKQMGRTGSLILVHGGCTSTGCFAMTDPVIEEVRELAERARENGQSKFYVNVFPFPLTAENLRRHSASPWLSFWKNLKEGYDLFRTQRLPPKVRVCDKRYVFLPGDADSENGDSFGEDCLKLTENVSGWQPSPRSSDANYHFSASRFRTAGGKIRCNPARASCRKWYAIQRKKHRQATRQGIRKRAHTVGRRQR